MRLRLRVVALLSCLVVAAAARMAAAEDAGSFDPAKGAVAGGVYVNAYFGLRYPLPEGWSAGPKPPAASYAGYYVLATPAPPEGARATLLIAAQDIFFAAPPIADARAMTEGLAKNAATADAAQPALSSVVIAGHSFARLNLPGSPLSRIVLATDLRCHVVIFTFAAADPDRLRGLAASLDHLQFSSGRPAPVCVKGYATTQTVLRRVEPVPAAPYFVSIPVRILVTAAGRVAQVHVIRATSAQRTNITDALRQWRFAPYLLNRRPVEIETGLTFRFAPAAR